ncbi:SDR family oxidoreductase [Dyadobacter sp. NIV53]|uniref:SDR family oxidoreductase n=1 Tax=Dyadobacter sp. NIV53 TaxID=2861765 RepID=UPI00286DF2C0|nr:SDR family oxidoreductase [Dyadobacter sp. NIV53]
MENKKVWFVTGASKGLGLTLVKELLSQGYQVAATSRTVESLTKEAGASSDNFLPLEVDLVSEESVKKAIDKTVEKFGTIDVVVNNAGYGQFGTLEEITDKAARQNFDINVFGSLNVIRFAMPYLRANRSGRIFNISSIAGFLGNFAGWGIYAATKFAVVGFTEALSAEIKSFGVKATVVYPGYFRTNFLESDSFSVIESNIAEYADAKASLDAHQQQINGNQQGDPLKASLVLIKVAADDNPPCIYFWARMQMTWQKQKLRRLKKI